MGLLIGLRRLHKFDYNVSSMATLKLLIKLCVFFTKRIKSVTRDYQPLFPWTEWPPLSWMKKFDFGLKFHWSLFLRLQLIIGLDNDLAPNRRQAITWTNANPIGWRIYAELGGDELNASVISIVGLRNGSVSVRCKAIVWTIIWPSLKQRGISRVTLHAGYTSQSN